MWWSFIFSFYFDPSPPCYRYALHESSLIGDDRKGWVPRLSLNGDNQVMLPDTFNECCIPIATLYLFIVYLIRGEVSTGKWFVNFRGIYSVGVDSFSWWFVTADLQCFVAFSVVAAIFL
ncbi:hypothetical protein, unlikely [Trypanosoma brucei gambiense DAL972]|uniref:Uncharacterized protein n=1 Tax=Trypanosoma brucei gambiense (strain MHOM/CI/86/DAL972) TaxID=679716 RepID=D0A7Q9_TRYB9|nr:hypothetical protein, unlikely [Trypanosoma brucei gambiense DAL972]CBH17710.1 hypothetical protein, unlikely [Trypanosoma brucei gambiense DAL972]|eukprot:XP_011779974.1 hypothetical protein, unlikely [Trypanosoma brucei gambiense DAL972]